MHLGSYLTKGWRRGSRGADRGVVGEGEASPEMDALSPRREGQPSHEMGSFQSAGEGLGP